MTGAWRLFFMRGEPMALGIEDDRVVADVDDDASLHDRLIALRRKLRAERKAANAANGRVHALLDAVLPDRAQPLAPTAPVDPRQLAKAARRVAALSERVEDLKGRLAAMRPLAETARRLARLAGPISAGRRERDPGAMIDADAVLARALREGRPLDEAITAGVRASLAARRWNEARGLAHSVAREVPVAAAVGAALCFADAGLWTTTVTALRDVTPDDVRRLMPVEHVTALYRTGRPTAAADEAAALADDRGVAAASRLATAQAACDAGDVATTRRLLASIAGDPPAGLDEAEAAALRSLSDWLTLVGGAPVASEAAAIALIDAGSPQQGSLAAPSADDLGILALLGRLAHLGRPALSGELAGSPRLVDRLFSEGATASAPIGLVLLDHAGRGNPPPDAWLLVHGRWSGAQPFAFDGRVEPLFLSFTLLPEEPVATEAIDLLRRSAPIGCRDRATLRLLRALDVPAFFSGCLAMMIEPPPPRALRSDTPDDDHSAEPARPDTLAGRLHAALDMVDGWIAREEVVVTASPDIACAARAVGHPAELRPGKPGDPELEGLDDLDADAQRQLAEAMRIKVDTVASAVAAGEPADRIRVRWAALCADEVAQEDRASGRSSPLPLRPSLDVEAAAGLVRSAARTIGSPPAPSETVINLALACDGRQKHHLPVALFSAVRNASRPVRAFLLARDMAEADIDALRRALPDTNIVVLPCDGIDYGPIARMAPHISAATMDRLLLPVLLPEVSRLVYVDLDTVTLGDVADLADLDLGGAVLAAKPNVTPKNRLVRQLVHRMAIRLDREGARELRAFSEESCPPDARAFNAGLLVLDLEALRRRDFTRRAIALVERYGMNDQDVLNCLAGAARAELPPGWNSFPAHEIDPAPKLLHWIGPAKPWGIDHVPSGAVWRGERDLWLERLHRP